MDYADYTTLTELREEYLSTTTTTEDATLLALIRSTSREMDAVAHRRFYPRIQTRSFDTPERDSLWLDDDLLELTTLLNGDGQAFTAGQYRLYPLNETPKHEVRVLSSSSRRWEASSSGDPEGAISATGVWGYHRYYSDAWLNTGATLSAAISSTTATALTTDVQPLRRGHLIRIDSEYMHVSQIANVVTVVRGVNGSTAATHSSGATVYRWYQPEIEMVCRMAAAAYYRLRTNPVGDSVQIGGESFSTPRDVAAWITRRLQMLGLIREAIG